MLYNPLATVVCVYKTGGDVYTYEYVRRLMNNCIANGAKKFICLTDDLSIEEFCKIVPLTDDLPGWWSKLELFKLPSNNRYVYFDLDTIVHGPIVDLLTWDVNFAMLEDFMYHKRLASGVMVWSGDHSYLYRNFNKDLIPKYTPALGGLMGDQAYIEDSLKANNVLARRLQYAFPGMFTSYKLHTKEERNSSHIVCYHGNPRPHTTNWSI